MKSNKQMLKEASLGLAKTFIILFCIIVFRLPFVWVAALILTLTVCLAVWQAYKGGWQPQWFLVVCRSAATTLLVLFIIAGVYKWLGDYTILAFLLVVFFISGLILWSKREEYMVVIRHIETQVWGATAEERRDAKKRRKPYE